MHPPPRTGYLTPPPLLADCTPPPLTQQLFVLQACLEGGGGLEGGEGALSPFTHNPNYTVLPIVHRGPGPRCTLLPGQGISPL